MDDPRWNEFATHHPDSTVFHLPVWASLIADCYRFNAFALTVRDDEDEIVAGLPVVEIRRPLGGVRWSSLPFTDACPLLVRPGVDADDVIAPLRDHVISADVRELELRGPAPAVRGVRETEVGYHHCLHLPSDLKDLHPTKNHTYNRNRARRAGVEVVRSTTAADVMAFYRLHTLTRHRLGVPVQPRHFFDLITEKLLEKGYGFVAMAVLDGEPLASGLYLQHNGTLIVKFHASDPTRPNSGATHLCDWEVIAAAFEEGVHTVDFGRTDFEDEGLRTYKSGLRATETPLVYTHISKTAGASAPVHVGDLSRRIIRGSPPWVCRALGETLYRWTA